MVFVLKPNKTKMKTFIKVKPKKPDDQTTDHKYRLSMHFIFNII